MCAHHWKFSSKGGWRLYLCKKCGESKAVPPPRRKKWDK